MTKIISEIIGKQVLKMKPRLFLGLVSMFSNSLDSGRHEKDSPIGIEIFFFIIFGNLKAKSQYLTFYKAHVMSVSYSKW